MALIKKCVAEAIGTMVLVIFGCGVAVGTGVDVVATSLAFGLVIVAMAYSIGNISGCHINPAVSLAMLISKKMNLKDFLFYIASQVVGAIIGAFIVALIFNKVGAVGANVVNAAVLGDGAQGLILGLVAEIILTFVFIMAILGVTSRTQNTAVVGIVIGLTLTLVHLLGIGLTGTSVNPARSIGPALAALINNDVEPLKQIWIFIVGPCAGSALAAVCYGFLDKKEEETKAAPESEKSESEAK